MGVESSISSKILLRHVISVLTIISLENRVASVNLQEELCNPAVCSKLMIGHHPFWNATIPSTHRSFQSECPDKPLLQLRPFGEYLLKHENQSLQMSSELKRTGEACFAPPTPPGESDPDNSISEPPSFLKSNRKPSYLAFFHYCNRSHVTLVSQPEDLHPYLPVCANLVFVPVELAKWNIEETENGGYEKFRHGFKAIWNLTSWDNCVKCKNSGGKCREGRDGCFLCERGNNHAALKIGVGSGVGALASIFLCSRIYVVRN